MVLGNGQSNSVIQMGEGANRAQLSFMPSQ